MTIGDEEERLDASDLIKRGTCFVAYQVQGELRFAPSRFLEYIDNKLNKYSTKELTVEILTRHKQYPEIQTA